MEASLVSIKVYCMMPRGYQNPRCHPSGDMTQYHRLHIWVASSVSQDVLCLWLHCSPKESCLCALSADAVFFYLQCEVG